MGRYGVITSIVYGYKLSNEEFSERWEESNEVPTMDVYELEIERPRGFGICPYGDHYTEGPWGFAFGVLLVTNDTIGDNYPITPELALKWSVEECVKLPEYGTLEEKVDDNDKESHAALPFMLDTFNEDGLRQVVQRQAAWFKQFQVDVTQESPNFFLCFDSD